MVLKRPLQISNGFWGDHHHWMFFGGMTIAINGFSMVFLFSYHCFQWFLMVPDHWSNNAMVSMDRCGLMQCNVGGIFLGSRSRAALHLRRSGHGGKHQFQPSCSDNELKPCLGQSFGGAQIHSYFKRCPWFHTLLKATIFAHLIVFCFHFLISDFSNIKWMVQFFKMAS